MINFSSTFKVKISHPLSLIVLSIVFLTSCVKKTNEEGLKQFHKNQIQSWNKKLTQVIITDVFSPPVCSRIYAYANIAAYEALIPSDSGFISFSKKLKGLDVLPKPDPSKRVNFSISSVIAFTTTAEKLVFNAELIRAIEGRYLEQLDSIGIDAELLANSISFGRAIGKHILKWASTDNYLQRNANPAYTVIKKPGRWVPTPPDYMDAVEPNWRFVRPFVLDSASQFRPGNPPSYNVSPKSPFYKEAMRVHDAVKHPAPGDSLTAWYWDDNPNTSVTQGHVTYFQQKMSPPGHWVHIACSVAEKENRNTIHTAGLVSRVAIAMADAFISCWEAKYFYNYVRPETFINQYIDPNWIPVIQTPPFPEYPSGHSQISAAAASILTQEIGENYAFTDVSEVPFGRPMHKFKSFYEASREASMSRLYGGIHFLPALDSGRSAGHRMGSFVLTRLHH